MTSRALVHLNEIVCVGASHVVVVGDALDYLTCNEPNNEHEMKMNIKMNKKLLFIHLCLHVKTVKILVYDETGNAVCLTSDV